MMLVREERPWKEGRRVILGMGSFDEVEHAPRAHKSAQCPMAVMAVMGARDGQVG
jgi:hypothetical protein